MATRCGIRTEKPKNIQIQADAYQIVQQFIFQLTKHGTQDNLLEAVPLNAKNKNIQQLL